MEKNHLLPLSYDFKIGDKVRISKFKKNLKKDIHQIGLKKYLLFMQLI